MIKPVSTINYTGADNLITEYSSTIYITEKKQIKMVKAFQKAYLFEY